MPTVRKIRHAALARWRLRSLAVAVLGAAVPFVVAGDSGAGPEVRFHGVTRAQQVTVESGLALFAEAGLELPPIEVVGHRSTEPCHGRPGYHRPSGHRSRIDLCTFRAGPLLQVVVLHELAHAWDRDQLTPERRQAFLRLRGLTTWSDGDSHDWHHLGAEHAAEIIMWGLIDRPVRLIRLDRNSCDELLAGYRVLTGVDPLHGYTEACRLDS